MATSHPTLYISLMTMLVIVLSACAPQSYGADQVLTETTGNEEINLDMENTPNPTSAGSFDQVEDDFPRTPDPISIQVTLDTPNAVSQSSYEFSFIMETNNAEESQYYMSIDNKLYNKKPDGSLVTAFGTEVTMTPISSIEGLPFSQGFLTAVQLGPDGLVMGIPARVTLTVSGNHEKDYIGFASDGSGQDFHLYPMSSAYADYNDTTDFSFDISHFGIFGVAQVTPAEIEAQQAHAPVSPSSQDEDDLAPLITSKLPYEDMAPLLEKQQLGLSKSHSRLVKPLIDNLANTNCDQVASTAFVFGEWYSKVDMFYYHIEYFQPQIDSDANALHERFIECAEVQCPVCMSGNSSQNTDPSTIDPFLVLATFAETLSFNTGFDDYAWWRQLTNACAASAGIKSPAGSTGGDDSGEGPAPTPIPFTCSPN